MDHAQIASTWIENAASLGPSSIAVATIVPVIITVIIASKNAAADRRQDAEQRAADRKQQLETLRLTLSDSERARAEQRKDARNQRTESKILTLITTTKKLTADIVQITSFLSVATQEAMRSFQDEIVGSTFKALDETIEELILLADEDASYAVLGDFRWENFDVWGAVEQVCKARREGDLEVEGPHLGYWEYYQELLVNQFRTQLGLNIGPMARMSLETMGTIPPEDVVNPPAVTDK